MASSSTPAPKYSWYPPENPLLSCSSLGGYRESNGQRQVRREICLRSNAMVDIEHARDAVETESVKLVLVHPKAQVAQQESHNFMVPVVEQSAVPQFMPAFTTTVEILVVSAVKLVQAIEDVLRRMAMDNIEKHDKAHAVCGVDELLQILRCSVAAASSKEIVDLVAETGIVGMLHDSHELDSVVAQRLDSRKHVLRELLVRRDFLLGRRYADMGLVHTNTKGLLRSSVFEDVSLRLWRVPEASIVRWRDREILRDVRDPRGQSVYLLSIWQHQQDLEGKRVISTLAWRSRICVGNSGLCTLSLEL